MHWFPAFSVAVMKPTGSQHMQAHVETHTKVATHTQYISDTDWLPLSILIPLWRDEMMNLLYRPVTEMDRYTHTTSTHTHTQFYLILHPSEHQRVLFLDPLEFSIPPLSPLPPAFDLNQRGCDLTVMNAETYHTVLSERVCVCIILNFSVISKVLFVCVKVVSL